MKIIAKIPWALENKLRGQVLNYCKQDKISYLNYRRIVVLKGNSILFKLFSFKDEFKADISCSETNNSVESLKYSISDNTYDILLDNSCHADINIFDTDIQNIDTLYILPEEFESFSSELN